MKLLDIVFNMPGMLLEEFSGSAIYHFTTVQRLAEILEEDTIVLSRSDMSVTDKDVKQSGGHSRYFSLTRIPEFFGERGYAAQKNATENTSKTNYTKDFYLARIEFDPEALNRSFFGEPVDFIMDLDEKRVKRYLAAGGHLADIIRKAGITGRGDAADIEAKKKASEEEERLQHDVSEISGLNSYIKQITIAVPTEVQSRKGGKADPKKFQFWSLLAQNQFIEYVNRAYNAGSVSKSKFKLIKIGDLLDKMPNVLGSKVKGSEPKKTGVEPAMLARVIAMLLWKEKNLYLKDWIRKYVGPVAEEYGIDIPELINNVRREMDETSIERYDKFNYFTNRTLFPKLRESLPKLYKLIQRAFSDYAIHAHILDDMDSIIARKKKLVSNLKENSQQGRDEEWVVEYRDEDGPDEMSFSSEDEAWKWIKFMETRASSSKFSFEDIYRR